MLLNMDEYDALKKDDVVVDDVDDNTAVSRTELPAHEVFAIAVTKMVVIYV